MPSAPCAHTSLLVLRPFFLSDHTWLLSVPHLSLTWPGSCFDTCFYSESPPEHLPRVLRGAYKLLRGWPAPGQESWFRVRESWSLGLGVFESPFLSSTRPPSPCLSFHTSLCRLSLALCCLNWAIRGWHGEECLEPQKTHGTLSREPILLLRFGGEISYFYTKNYINKVYSINKNVYFLNLKYTLWRHFWLVTDYCGLLWKSWGNGSLSLISKVLQRE